MHLAVSLCAYLPLSSDLGGFGAMMMMMMGVMVMMMIPVNGRPPAAVQKRSVWCIMSTSASPPLFNYFSRAIGAFRCNQRPSDRNLEIWNFTPFYLFIYSCIFGLIKRPVGGLKWAGFHTNQKALKTTCSAFPHLLNVFLNKLHIRCIPMNEVFFFLVSLPHDLRRMSRCGLNGMQLRRDCKGWRVCVCVFQRCPNRPVLCEGRCSGVSGLNIL